MARTMISSFSCHLTTKCQLKLLGVLFVIGGGGDNGYPCRVLTCGVF